jgi:hypothetical protein
MSDDIKVIVFAMIRTNPNGIMTVNELEKVWKEQEGIPLINSAKIRGFDSIISMIHSWNGISIDGTGLAAVLKVKPDFISDMNRFSK